METKKKPESSESSKRYRYTGPPAISLGSWSERPSVNVQIKNDTDYKFGPKRTTSLSSTTTKNSNSVSTGSKTIVNLNSSSNDVEIINYKDKNNLPKSNEYKNGNSGTNIVNMTINNHEDIKNKNTTTKNVVNLRKAIDNNEKIKLNDDDIKIDTRPVNFKELTQQFGQIKLRTKPKFNSLHNRHSDYFDNRQKIIDNNNIIKSNDVNKSSVNKRYTSVVGINNSTNGSCNNSGTIMRLIGNNSSLTKINGSSVPVVKGFKSEVKDDATSLTTIQVKKSTLSVPTPPPPPPPTTTTTITTMPVITGVTLKNSNSRPKSMPARQIDSHDQLLESIRNFGRDKKLKCVKNFS